MANSFVGIDEPAVIDKKLDTEQLVVGANTVERERVQIAGATDTAIVSVVSNRLSVDGSGVTQPISAASLPLPTGAATAAAQLPNSHDVTVDNGAGASAVNIQDGGNSITVDGPLTDAQLRATPVPVSGTVSVTEPVSVDDNSGSLTVDAPTATPVPIAVTTTGDVLVKPGDSGNNAIRVNIVAGAGSGGTAQADESAFTEGTTSFTPIGGVVNDTITSDPTEDQAAAARITPKRAIHVNLRANDGSEVSVGGGTQYDEDTASAAADKITMAGVVRKDTAATLVDTDGDRTQLQVDAVGRLYVNGSGVTQPISATDLDIRNLAPATDEVKVTGAAADGAAVSGNPVLIAGQDGTNAQSIKTDSSGELQVDVLTQPALSASTDEVRAVGTVAHDAAISGNPVLVGGMTETPADSAPANRVSAEGDVARVALDPDGSAFVLPHGPQVFSMHFDGSTAQTDLSVHAAPGAGLSLYVTDIVISKDAATAMNVFFEEGSTKVLGPYYLEAIAGRGLVIQFRTPKKITANTALTVTSSAAIAHAIDVTGYVGRG